MGCYNMKNIIQNNEVQYIKNRIVPHTNNEQRKMAEKMAEKWQKNGRKNNENRNEEPTVQTPMHHVILYPARNQ